MNLYRKFGKRTLDIILSGGALICLSPVLAGVTIWLHFANKGAGAFFFQLRPGKNARIFKIWKFKSMTDERDSEGKLLPDYKRITPIGRFIRSTSIDELPQLWNILKGDMSIIGPRPLVPQYLPFYTEEEAHRHDVRPGMTGMAQSHGRKSLNWDEKFAYDVEYVRNLSFALDFDIFCRTVKSVIKRSDVNPESRGAINFDDWRRAQWEKGINLKK